MISLETIKAILLQLFVSLVTGLLFFLLSRYVSHIVIINAVVLGLIGGGVSVWPQYFLNWSTRTRFVFSVAGGVIAYWSMYYFQLISIAGWRSAIRLDWLVSYVLVVMQEQQVGEEPPNAGANWVLFVIETAVTGALFGYVAKKFFETPTDPTSARLKCSHCQRWMKSKTVLVPSEYASQLIIAVHEGKLDTVPEDESHGEVEGGDWSSVMVEFCFHSKGEVEPLLLLTAKETRSNSKGIHVLIVVEREPITAAVLLQIAAKVPELAVEDA